MKNKHQKLNRKDNINIVITILNGHMKLIIRLNNKYMVGL